MCGDIRVSYVILTIKWILKVRFKPLNILGGGRPLQGCLRGPLGALVLLPLPGERRGRPGHDDHGHHRHNRQQQQDQLFISGCCRRNRSFNRFRAFEGNSLRWKLCKVLGVLNNGTVTLNFAITYETSVVHHIQHITDA